MLQTIRRTGVRFALFSLLGGSVTLTSAAVNTASAQAVDPSTLKNPFPKMPEGVVPRFELRDTRALDMLQYMHCMNTTVAAARRGLMGAVPDSALVVCVREPNEWRGVAGMLSTDRSQFRILSQLSLRNGGTRTSEAIDTAKAAAIARALVRGASTPQRGGANYSFTAVPLSLPTFIEVWFMPVQSSATKMLVGGDSIIQMTTDGRREQGHVKKAPTVREIPMPSGQTFVLESGEDEVPLVSELLAARLSLTRVHEVRIRTKKYESVISNTTRKWAHAPRRS